MTEQQSPKWATPQRIARFAVFWVGVFIVGALLVKPTVGLYLLWDVLIPVAPLLLVVAPGIWRNICPLGTFSVMPHWLRLSKKKLIGRKGQSRLFAGAVLLLLVIVPARHVILDTNGVVIGVTLVAVALLAFALGLVLDWKSAWCSGLCPVYPVEMLYGTRPVVTPPNLQCKVCTGCVSPCRDSNPSVSPTDVAIEPLGKFASTVLIGGFPGFVLGWYLVDISRTDPIMTIIAMSYAWPFVGLIASLTVYSIARKLAPAAGINQLFATAAVCIYYWFKMPVIFGLSGDSSHWLLSLAGSTPSWTIWVLRFCTIGLLSWLL
ncbi:MAG: hypothetical protein L3J82_09030, partial [Planctomycetes bacterium]|nr:hypothetical protein [Planctomycetota bacterium]